jgi:CRISPR-associated endonuclease/helicase Cas3
MCCGVKSFTEDSAHFWAKTTPDGRPGISVRDHCLNVGCVAEALIGCLPPLVQELLPRGAATLAALHDVGKISAGFLRKCPAWLIQNQLSEAALLWTTAEGDHSKVSQFCLQELLKPARADLWAVAAGAHHGRLHGKRIQGFNQVPDRAALEEEARRNLVRELSTIFGALPEGRPREGFSDLWLLAGLIAVADWIGSNERFFSPADGLSIAKARQSAAESLAVINWSGGSLRPEVQFPKMFNLPGGPNALQRAMQGCAKQPALLIVEGPMGCGKTEAALAAAHALITAGHNHGIYFGLPTQVTSNRIHERVAGFLRNTLAGAANLCLAHSASWLTDAQTLRLAPTADSDEQSRREAGEARSWFASSKHALLARYGVGTIDQALQGVVAVKHFFVRRFGLAGKVVILDEIHSYDVYTGALITQLIRELLALRCSVIVLSATLTRARRQELLAAAGEDGCLANDASSAADEAYPLVTAATGRQPVTTLPLEWPDKKTIQLRVAPIPQPELLAECLRRAEAGQHVLYIRNTVAEAQATYRAFAGEARAGTVRLGLLHSRFPYFQREQLENDWLHRLGKERTEDSLGSVLVATQVVEQSVDIDLDFIVSDLAPTDMLLQRMGRLWRHTRLNHRAAQPEFWINVPELSAQASAANLKPALGKSGRVYAPYVLLRTAEVFAGRESIVLPAQIRELLEATYAEHGAKTEPEAWAALRAELERDKEQLKREADAAALVLGRPTQEDRDEILTRRAGAPTCTVVLLKAMEPIPHTGARLTTLEGLPVEASDYAWQHASAKALYRTLVRAPRFTVPKQTAPAWLSLHVPGPAAWAIVQADGRCHFPDAAGDSPLAYDSQLGLFCDSNKPQPRRIEDDNEFDY